MKEPVRVAVTGAAGQIGYSLLFRIASGAMLGPDQPVILHLLEITPALGALGGVVMELDDCAFPLLAGVVETDDAHRAFDGVNVGRCSSVPGRARRAWSARTCSRPTARSSPCRARPSRPGAARRCAVLVVGNPANTNCLIAMNNAPTIGRDRFTAMTRLDHNRAKAQLAARPVRRSPTSPA